MLGQITCLFLFIYFVLRICKLNILKFALKCIRKRMMKNEELADLRIYLDKMVHTKLSMSNVILQKYPLRCYYLVITVTHISHAVGLCVSVNLECGWEVHLQTPSSVTPVPPFNQNPHHSLTEHFCSSENTPELSSAPSSHTPPSFFLSSGAEPHQAFNSNRALGISDPAGVGREWLPIIFKV